MIEVTFTYDLRPDINKDKYIELVKRATAMMLMADGFIEFRAHRNMLGSPHVRRTSVWDSLSHWAEFAQKPDFQDINSEFPFFVINLDVQIWGPSPITPETIKP